MPLAPQLPQWQIGWQLVDEFLHEAHLTCRLHGEPSRGGHRHMQNFGKIRQLQTMLQDAAKRARVADYDVADPEDLTQTIVDQVVTQIRNVEDSHRVGAA